MAAQKKSKSKPAQKKSKARPVKRVSAKAKRSAKRVAAKTKQAAAQVKKAAANAKKAVAKAAKRVTKAARKPIAKSAKAAKRAKRTKSEASSLLKKVKDVASKVKQAAAAAAVTLIDADAGKAAPSFDLTDEKGAHVTSASLTGKPYLLYFYPKDDTPGCTKEACDIRDNFARFGQHGLRVLGVSPDSAASHAKFGKKYGLPFTLLSDPDKALANAYGVWGKKQNYGKEYMGIIRSSFLVGADGTIKKSYRGVKVDGHVDAVLSDAQALL